MTLDPGILFAIAAKAGDIKTVRKWARGDRKNMKPRTRARIEQAARELGVEVAGEEISAA